LISGNTPVITGSGSFLGGIRSEPDVHEDRFSTESLRHFLDANFALFTEGSASEGGGRTSDFGGRTPEVGLAAGRKTGRESGRGSKEN
jgi:hypothetical protein